LKIEKTYVKLKKGEQESDNQSFTKIIENLDRIQFFYHCLNVEAKKRKDGAKVEFTDTVLKEDIAKMIKIAKGFQGNFLNTKKEEDKELLDYLENMYEMHMSKCRNLEVNEEFYEGWLKAKEEESF